VDFSKIKGAIFDLDGTVLDSMWVWRQIDIDFLGRRGLAVPEGYMQDTAHMNFLDAACYTIERFGFHETPEEIMDEWRTMALEAYSTKVPLKPRVRELLERLERQGTKIAVATSADDVLYKAALEHNGVGEILSTVITARQVGRGKAFPDIYLAAADALELPPHECAVFEDILAGIRSAASAGFYTVAVYDSANESQWPEIKAAADMAITDFGEISEILNT
jgi:HAD superfamily hydrolase (TIGR01509 family)